MTLTVQGVRLPDSQLGRQITELVRDTESPLIFHHSSRVYDFGALAGKHRGISMKQNPTVAYRTPATGEPVSDNLNIQTVGERGAGSSR
jgi:hypothetical protein